MEKYSSKLNFVPNQILGRGTHGTVFQSSLSTDLAVKVFKQDNSYNYFCKNGMIDRQPSSLCLTIKEKEYSYQEIIHDFIEQEKINGNIASYLTTWINIPDVKGYNHAPTIQNPIYCSYMMEKIAPLPNSKGLIQLPLHYDRDYLNSNITGTYMGLDTLRSYLASIYSPDIIDKVVLTIVEAMAVIHAILHYGLSCDGFDIEYVLARKDDIATIYALDFDKVSFYSGRNCISRKIAEDQYEPRPIATERDIIKLLATSFTYDPRPDYPEYKIWRDGYIEQAAKYGQELLARKVMDFRLNYY